MKAILIFILLTFLQAFALDISSITLKTDSGKIYHIQENMNNDANIILFWATWCLPCQKEFPHIQSLFKKYPDKKIKVFAISKDSPRSLAKVKSFIKQHDYDFTYLLDSDNKVSSNFMVDVIPHSILADSTGKIVYTHTGYRKGDELELEKQMLKLWQE